MAKPLKPQKNTQAETASDHAVKTAAEIAAKIAAEIAADGHTEPSLAFTSAPIPAAIAHELKQTRVSSVAPHATISTGLEEARFVSYPDSPFQLFQPYPPAGDQPHAINLLEEGIRDGLMHQTLLGVTGSGKTFTMANVIARLGRPAVVLAPNKTLAAQLYAEMREFFPKNAVEYFVSYYDYYQPEAYVPTRDLFIEKDSSINEHIEQMRLSATKSLLERRDTIIVGTVSCIYGIGNPGDYHAMVLSLRTGDRIERREILARLVAMQYDRNDSEFVRGTFRARGETIDVFPAESAELVAVNKPPAPPPAEPPLYPPPPPPATIK